MRDTAERLASDLAFLSLWAVFLRDGVTPLDDVRGVIFALAPAAIIGWLGVAALEYVVINFFHSRAQAAEKDAEEAAAVEAQAIQKAEAPKRRRGAAARRRAAQGTDPSSEAPAVAATPERDATSADASAADDSPDTASAPDTSDA